MNNTLKNDFEKLYLRFNITKRALNALSQERVNEILQNTDFRRCTKYIANCVFAKHRIFLTSHGFWKEDMESIAQIFGINFYLYNVKADTKKGENTLLMRYVSQRFQNFIIWGRRKFGMEEKIYEVPGHTAMFVDKFSMPWDNESSVTLSDKVGYASEDCKNIRKELKATRGSKNPEILANRAKLRVQSNTLRKTLSTLNTEKKTQLAAEKKLTASLLKKLDKEWPKHKDTLSHYATSKCVPFDVRKKAKKFCKKYGIDYAEWAKERMANGTLNEEEVSL